jgi:endonuclease III
MARADGAAVVRELLGRRGQTYAEEAGIRLADKPSPLYQLLVLATLLSARISAGIAVAAARELFAAGYRSPQAMRKASWQDRVDALGRGHYRRYDERTSTMLGDAAELLIHRWRGDLRRLREEAGGDPGRIAELLTEFPGIGPVGADIFLREVQAVWPQVAPHLGDRVSTAAGKLGLPTGERELADLVAPRDLARLAAALTRVSRSRQEIREIETGAGR